MDTTILIQLFGDMSYAVCLSRNWAWRWQQICCLGCRHVWTSREQNTTWTACVRHLSLVKWSNACWILEHCLPLTLVESCPVSSDFKEPRVMYMTTSSLGGPPPFVTVRSFFPETWIWNLVEVGWAPVTRHVLWEENSTENSIYQNVLECFLLFFSDLSMQFEYFPPTHNIKDVTKYYLLSIGDFFSRHGSCVQLQSENSRHYSATQNTIISYTDYY